MTQQEQINCFAKELTKLIDRYADEFDLSYAAVVGVLKIKADGLSAQARRTEEKDP